jgi:hypothetical protein
MATVMHNIDKTLVVPWTVKNIDELEFNLKYETHRPLIFPGSHKFLSDYEESNTKKAIAQGITQYHLDDVIYHFNHLGFRGDWSFSDIISDTKSIKILFLGCSCTFGEGLPDEAVWCNILSKMLKNHFETPIKTANVAICGSSITNQTRLLSLIAPHVKFDIAIMLAPHISRHEYFQTLNSARPHRYGLIANFKNSLVASAQDHFYKFANQEYLYYDYLRSVEHATQIAKTNNLPLLIGSWNQEASELITNHTSAESLPEFRMWEFFTPELNNKKARDGMHPGPFSNKHYAELIFNQVAKKLTQRINHA